MTEALGRGSRVRYVGGPGMTNHEPLLVGRVYVVSDIVEGQLPCALCGSFVGLLLAGIAPRNVPPWGRMAWSPCAFRPEGDGEAEKLKKHLKVRPKVGEPV